MNNQDEFEKIISELTETKPSYVIKPTLLDPEIGLWDECINYGGYGDCKIFKIFNSKKIGEFKHHVKKKKALREITGEYIFFIYSEIKNAIESFEVIESRGVAFHFQTNAAIYLLDSEPISYTINNVEEKYFNQIVNFSEARFELLNELQSEFEEIIGDTNNIDQTYKLELLLSVPEIALLFRLLDEQKLINYKNKTEIYRFIANSIKTKNQANISEASIKNKFLSPDNAAIKNFEVLLTNLRLHLRQIQ